VFKKLAYCSFSMYLEASNYRVKV